MFNRGLAAIVVSLVLIASQAKAEQPPMIFSHLSRAEGLSQVSVNDILQDSQGFIWLATQNGLNRYDGVRVKRYFRERNQAGGLASASINALDQDSAGNVWLATDGGGVAVWSPRTDTFKSYRHIPGDERSLATDFIHDILIDSEDNVWLATRDKGLDRLDPVTGEVTHFVHNESLPGSISSNRNLYALLQDAEGALWVSTSAGLDRYLGDGKGFQHFSPPEVVGGVHQILELEQDSQGYLWLGSFDVGLHRLDIDSGRFVSYQHNPANPASLSHNDIRAIFEDASNRLWIGTANGLDLFDRVTGSFQNYRNDRGNLHSLADNFVSTITQDRNGLLWVGTMSGGASRWNPRSWLLGHRHLEKLTDLSPINAFADAPDGGLWVGTMDAGLLQLEEGTGEILSAKEDLAFVGQRVMSLLNDRGGNLWVGTMSEGIYCIGADRSRKHFRSGVDGTEGLGADGIMSLYEDQSGRIWVGTYEGGVSVYDPETDIIHRNRDASGELAWFERIRATAIAQDHQGRMWVATEGDGLLLLDETGGLLHQFLHDPEQTDSLASNALYSLHVDQQGSLWIGTADAGLDHVVDMEADLSAFRFENLSQADGLSNNVIYAIETDEVGSLWLSSNNGLMRLDPQKKLIRSFHTSNGAQGEEYTLGASFRSASGRLLFAGTHGYNDFDPQQVQASEVIPPVVFTEIYVQHQPLKSELAVPMLDTLELGYSENSLSLEFAALDFTDPRRNQYAYRLEGHDDRWIRLGNERRVSYTNLAAGDYLFRVKAASADSTWNEEGAQLAITVRPAPWRTWWAYAAYAVLAALLLLTIYRYYTRRLLEQREYANRLAREVADRTAELKQRSEELADASSAKSAFLARMSHEIRTPMNGVMGMTQLLSTTNLDSQQRLYTNTITQSSQALLHIINDILDLSKIEAGHVVLESMPFDIEHLVDECLSLLASQASGGKVKLRASIEPDVPAILIGDALRIRQVLINLLGNALKFTAHGEVLVRVAIKTRTDVRTIVRIEVVDTGIGIDQKVLGRLFEAFSQADESNTRRFGGTGLGLSICKQLIELMGGEIGVTSQLGLGSTFWCEIPLLVKEDALQEYDEQSLPPDTSREEI